MPAAGDPTVRFGRAREWTATPPTFKRSSVELDCGVRGWLGLQSFMWQLFKEFLLFLRQEKKWWLVPLVVILLVLGALIVFTGGSVLAPLMYPFL